MYREERGDLFKNVRQDGMAEFGIAYAQCISQDAEMGAGIALQFNKYFNTKEKTIKELEKLGENSGTFLDLGKVSYVEPVFLFVTKRYYWEKPSLEEFKQTCNTLVDAIMALYNADECNYLLKEIRCPMLGCGLDKLDWKDVKPILEATAEKLMDLHIDLVVIDYRLPVGDTNVTEKE